MISISGQAESIVQEILSSTYFHPMLLIFQKWIMHKQLSGVYFHSPQPKKENKRKKEIEKRWRKTERKHKSK